MLETLLERDEARAREVPALGLGLTFGFGLGFRGTRGQSLVGASPGRCQPKSARGQRWRVLICALQRDFNTAPNRDPTQAAKKQDVGRAVENKSETPTSATNAPPTLINPPNRLKGVPSLSKIPEVEGGAPSGTWRLFNAT